MRQQRVAGQPCASSSRGEQPRSGGRQTNTDRAQSNGKLPASSAQRAWPRELVLPSQADPAHQQEMTPAAAGGHQGQSGADVESNSYSSGAAFGTIRRASHCGDLQQQDSGELAERADGSGAGPSLVRRLRSKLHVPARSQQSADGDGSSRSLFALALISFPCSMEACIRAI